LIFNAFRQGMVSQTYRDRSLTSTISVILTSMNNCFPVVVLTQLLLLSFSLSAQPEIKIHHNPYLDNLYESSILFDTTTLKPEETIGLNTDLQDGWKQWRTVDNYFYGKNRGSLPMIADLEALHPYFRDRVVELIRVCQDAGITLAIVESYRTPAKQAEYYAMGKKYTSTPGGKSRHQYGLAVDVVPIVDSVAVWDNHRLWKKIGMAGEHLGLRWGGRWRALYDPGHFEWSGGLSRYELAKGKLPMIPASRSGEYPEIISHLKQLQTYWEAWEAEQSILARNAPAKKAEEGVTGVSR